MHQLFIDPQIKYPIYNLNLNFTDYITQCQQLITQYRLDLNTAQSDQIIAANSPFELHPTQTAKYGALLIHGLFDSPFLMRDIGLGLQAQGLLTRAILLPGHGTLPGALLNVDYRQWLQAVRYGIATLAREVDKIFLVGYSTGATLALYHALQNPSQIAGIVSLAPALKIGSALAGITNTHQCLSWAWPRAAWLTQDKDETADYARYRSIPFNAVYQVYRLIQAVKQSDPAKFPLFFALPQNDSTVCSHTSLRYFQHQANFKNQLILYTNDAATFIDPRIVLRPAAYPQLHISGISHLAIPISPQNPHYGENGDYSLASHVTVNNNMIYGEFSPLQLYFNDWLYQFKLAKHRYQRLSFNPDFAFLMRSISQFTASSMVNSSSL